MNVSKASTLLLMASLLLWNSCQQKTSVEAPITVSNEGKISLYGKEIALENLKTALLDTLVQMATIPDEVEVVYGDQILMGMRGEVRTEVTDAIIAAKESRSKPVVVTNTFWKQEGTDCDLPDTLRTNCAVINFDYPVVYFKEATLHKSVAAWVTPYLTGILAAGTDEGTAPANTTLEDGAEIFFDTHKSYDGSVMAGAFIAESSNKVLLNDGKHLTLELEGYTFQGGAHGSPTALVGTFDVQTGKQLTWDDLVTDKAALQVLAEKKFRVVRADDFNDGFNFDETFPFKLPDNFGLTDTGVYFHYLAYEVGPYVMGNTTFTLTFEELGALARAR